SKLAMARLQNKSGQFIAPSVASGRAALEGIEMPESLRVFVPNPEGKEAYPIVTYTWVLCRKKYHDPKVAETLRKLFEYCLTDGQKISADLGYIPLPEPVVAKVRAAVQKIGP